MYEVTAPHSSARRSLLFCASPQRRRYTSDEIEIRRLGIRSVRNGSSDRPGDDFFRYANGTWINKRQIPPDKPAYSLRLAMTDLTEQRLHEMMESLGAKSNEHPSTLEERSALFTARSWTKRGLSNLARKQSSLS
ncbi:MAG: hypothetical protein DMF44_11595 [Verrucomicrobia bacterium]|nr:MAG: hypothetical protein DMF44_11595 [Verrucomicrobiota bacterium]PYL48836.1 MAG: hypothetical protein DMF32_08440 [Verrucomicrobiota bacterium]